ncbi:MAG: DUF5752 family protein [Candidatus Bathyarchaeota archaeon]|nr:DUF5752 family protein [Candidatus Bathyarchaeota archaeon]
MEKASREKSFYFFTSVGNYIGESASSLEEFLEKVKLVDIRSLEFHRSRGDFERWLREVWGHEKLAKTLKKIERLKLDGEELRTQILNATLRFLKSRKGKIQGTTKTPETTDLDEYLRQLPPAPKEHAFELEMEQRLKKLLREKEKEHSQNT